jgi:hypothetical protein
MQHWDDLADWVNYNPEPEQPRPVPQTRAQFVHEQMRETQVLEDAIVQYRTVFAREREPAGDCRMPVAKHPYSRRDIEPFCERGQHFCNAL